MEYFVKRTVNFGDFIAIDYVGKGHRSSVIPNHKGWSRRHFAENWLEEYGSSYFCGRKAEYEIIELK